MACVCTYRVISWNCVGVMGLETINKFVDKFSRRSLDHNTGVRVIDKERTAATKNEKKKTKTCVACKSITPFVVVIMTALDRPTMR